MGGNPLTFAGLTGMGDLIVTWQVFIAEMARAEICLEKDTLRRSVRKHGYGCGR